MVIVCAHAVHRNRRSEYHLRVYVYIYIHWIDTLRTLGGIVRRANKLSTVRSSSDFARITGEIQRYSVDLCPESDRIMTKIRLDYNWNPIGLQSKSDQIIVRIQLNYS